MSNRSSRRDFLRRAAAATAVASVGLPATRRASAARRIAANERLSIGVVGVAARGAANLHGVAHEIIVALCDIDSDRLDEAAQKFPHAKKYADYRTLLEKEELDALVVSTPDHTHAIPVAWALKRGLDVYCEKPLAHSVWEVRQLRELAAENNAVTQMGTQIHAGDNYRRVVEAIQSGTIGKVDRVHVWQANAIKPGTRVAAATPPAHVDYDLWLGPAPERPFHASHFHFDWRYWWDFGGGILADMGCHYIDLPFWSLGLRFPTSVAAQGSKSYTGDNEVPDRLRVDYQFPARDDQPPVHLTWYHGDLRPQEAEGLSMGSAVLFEGSEGRLLSNYNTHKFFMDADGQPSIPEPSISASIGHHREWTEACKSRTTTTCNFDYSGPLAETVLLGNVSYRAGQQQLDWDADTLTATNCPEAAQFIRRPYRAGWTL